MTKDLYEVLQVSPNAEPEVVEAAYRRLARKYHPDVSRSPDAATRMREIVRAFEILGDASRRAAYDAAHPRDSGRGGSTDDEGGGPTGPARRDPRLVRWLGWTLVVVVLAILTLPLLRALLARGFMGLLLLLLLAALAWYVWRVVTSESGRA